MSPDLPPGVSVVAELGRGARTVVYRVARDGRGFAMKVFLAGSDPAAARELRREAALLAWTDHPALPRVFEVGQAGPRPYLIMEFIQGRSLGELLRVRPLAVDRTVRLGGQLAGALAALHEVGLVHRDVKPHNIMIEPDGAARLIDLGMAGRGAGTPTETAVGTLRYSAPEQGGTLNRPVDARSDLYALGAVLHECLTGTPPFAAAEATELLRLHAGAAPPGPRDVRPEVPAALAAVIAKLLAKDPDDRYQSAAGLGADLRRIGAEPLAAGTPDTTRPAEPGRPEAEPATTEAERATTEAEPATREAEGTPGEARPDPAALPDTGDEGATILAERIRAALADHPVDTDAGPLTVTASIGLAPYVVTDTEPGSLLARADEALYDAKKSGRNRVAHRSGCE